jgi:hypothetical protein
MDGNARTAAGRPCPAQRLYERVRRQLHPGHAAPPEGRLAWCAPDLVRAVAVPLGAQHPPRIELWLTRPEAARHIPARERIGGEWVAIDTRTGGAPLAQARASNVDADVMHDGMLSAIVRDRFQHDRHYLLSCGHVLAGSARARKGDRIELSEGSRVLGHGELEDWSPVLGDGIPRVGIDAGIVRVDAGLVDALPPALLPTGVSMTFRLDQDVVLQVGSGNKGKLKTRWSGYVDLADSERPQDYYLEDAVGYLLESDTEAGDSGAAVWNTDGKLMGIHVGVPAGDERWRSNAILCPIDKIMDWFDIEPILTDGRPPDVIPDRAAQARPATVPETAAPASPGVPVPSGDEDIATVAMTLWGEARGEGEAGMEAVACVIGNRVRRRWRGKQGYAAVCRDRWQFSCWNENDPNRMRLEAVRRAPDDAFRRAMDIAGRLVRNELDDFTFGATHYYAVSLPSPPNWALNKRPCYRQGRHLFFNDIN